MKRDIKYYINNYYIQINLTQAHQFPMGRNHF